MTQLSDDTECISADSERCNTSTLGVILLLVFALTCLYMHILRGQVPAAAMKSSVPWLLLDLWEPWGMQSELAVSWRKPPPCLRTPTQRGKVLSNTGWQILQIKRRHKRSLAGRALGRSIPLQAKAAPVWALCSPTESPRLQQSSSSSMNNNLQRV